jgi:hypothetical protein
MAFAFLTVGTLAMNLLELPAQVGIFVAPPSWIVGAVLAAFAVVLFLVGIMELARWLSPAIEVTIDANGIATYGLLGAERVGWSDLTSLESQGPLVVVGTRRRRRNGTSQLVIDTSRLDAEPAQITRGIVAHRSDLAPPVAASAPVSEQKA